MADPFIGEIRIFGFNFPPNGWAQCNGQLLSIQQNTALFSLLGTQYGGDGRVSFGLPDLRSRVPLHFVQGNGLSFYNIGDQTGEERHTLLGAELPSHNHQVNVASGVGTQSSPAGAYLAAAAPSGQPAFAADGLDATLGAASVAATGGNQAHNNLQPSLAVNFCIALVGIFPSRG